jgi:hypothetical protein
MRASIFAQALIAIAAAATMVGAQAQSKPTPVGEANDHTSANAASTGTPKIKNATGNVNPGVVPPKVGEANDATSANAVSRPAAKTRPAKVKTSKAKAPVTGEANDHSSTGGSTEAGKAAKDAKTGM